jgi:phage terminase large subunit
VPYNGGEAPIDKERFVNARVASSRARSIPMTTSSPLNSARSSGASTPRGRIKIESKDDMRKRGLPSPDRADCAAIAFPGRANAAPINVESHAGESITGDLMTKAW